MKATFLIALVLVVTLCSIPWKASATAEHYDIAIIPKKSIYLQNDPCIINVFGNASTPYTLAVLAPNGSQVLARSRNTNASGTDILTLKIPENYPPGTSSLTASMGNTVATAKITILNTSGWQPSLLPYSRMHCGVNYTITARYFEADGTGTDYIKVTYPSLPGSFIVNAFVNDMCFAEKIRSIAYNVSIDLVYVFVDGGMKLWINGTVPSITSFKFNVNATRFIHKLDSLRSGLLVFDWTDIRNSGSTFSFSLANKEVTVQIPSTFEIDPYVFQDGFESGDTSAWTGKTESNGNATVFTGNSHHGTYALNGTAMATWGSGYVYESLTPGDLYFLRAYVKFNVLPPTGGKITCVEEIARGTTVAAQAAIINFFGDWRWRIDHIQGNNFSVSCAPVNQTKWYCMELGVKYDTGTAGWASLTVDNTLIYNATGLNFTNLGGQPNKASTGLVYTDDTSSTVFVDCAVVDTAPIGLETSNTPTLGSFLAPSIIYANKYSFINCTANDADGKTDLSNVTIQIGTAQFSWVSSTGIFSEITDPSNYWTLDAANSVKTDMNTTAVTLSWKLKGYWNATEGSANINGTVYDALAASGTGSQTGLYTFESDIIIFSTSHSPTYPETETTFTITGQIYYNGSTTAPEDPTGITVKVSKNDYDVASTTAVTSGQFSISYNEAQDGTNTYLIYATTDKVTAQNSTEIVEVRKRPPGQNPPSNISPPPDQNNKTAPPAPVVPETVATGWTMPANLNVAIPVILFVSIAGILFDASRKNVRLSGTRKTWTKRAKVRKGFKLHWKKPKKVKTEWKKEKPWE